MDRVQKLQALPKLQHQRVMTPCRKRCHPAVRYQLAAMSNGCQTVADDSATVRAHTVKHSSNCLCLSTHTMRAGNHLVATTYDGDPVSNAEQLASDIMALRAVCGELGKSQFVGALRRKHALCLLGEAA